MESLIIYTNVFAGIGLVTLFIGALMWMTSPRLSRYIREKQIIKPENADAVDVR